MAFLGIEVPPEVGRLLTSLEIEGEREPLDQLHITMVYFGSKTPLDVVMKASEILHDLVKNEDHFTCSLDHIEHFEPSKHSDGKYPIICPVTSPALYKVRAKLAKSLDEAEIEYAKNFDFKAHVTLAYADEIPKVQKFAPLKWEVYEIVLWGGDSGPNRISIRVPFRHGELPLKVAERFAKG